MEKDFGNMYTLKVNFVIKAFDICEVSSNISTNDS